MKITWYGHAAFLVETNGTRIILDPYRSPDSGGYLPIDETADVVVVSHENDRYHSHLGQIRPPFEVVRGLELPAEGLTVRGIRFEAVHVFETPERLAEDEVTMLHFRAEGLHIVHLGDLGHPLEPDELAPIRGADVVLLPAGGPPTMALEHVPELLHAIGPKIVVPMHFKTPKINLNILPIERFLEVVADWPIEVVDSCSFDASRDRLPSKPTIVVLEHAR